MNSRRAGLLVVVLATAGIVLTACAPTPTPTSTPGGAASTAPSATPTPTAAADPSIRVPLKCADLFPAAKLSALTGVALTTAVDETTQPTDLEDAADVQKGILTCSWGGKDRTDGGYDQTLALSIEPDGTDDFTANFTYLQKQYKNIKVDNYGDHSVYGCDAGGGFQCSANVLVGGYWLTVDLHNINADVAVSKATAQARITQVLDSAVPVIKNAGAAGAVWTAPAGTSVSFCSQKNSQSLVRSAFASPGLASNSDPGEDGFDVATIATSGTQWATCGWVNPGDTPKGQASDVGVNILTGGAWAIPKFVATPPTQWYVGTYKPVTVPGTTGAVLACNNADCGAIVGIGSDAVEISFTDLGAKHNLAGLMAMVKAIAAS